MFELNNFDSMQIAIAGPDKIREWSHGEVTKPETINYRTQKPERDGLFCERIFGPTKDWECHCGKYKRIRYKGVICDKCGVEVTRAKVRRERMGHIELAAPVTHIWYFRGVPSRIGLLLDMPPKALEQVVYFVNYLVLDAGTTDLERKQILTDAQLLEAREKWGENAFRVGMGAEAVQELLKTINLKKEYAEVKETVEKSTGPKKVKAIKRLDILDSFVKSGNDPKWMVLEVLPVMPPELRPMVQLDGGRFATSDLNDLYRRVINRNNRLKRLMELGAPDIIVRNEKRMLQEAVDALIDNGRRGKAVSGAGNRELKSLSGLLRGKQGRFRQNLLGKRVDYSGRSVIVVGPELKMYQCGLPKEMALELFKPFIMKELVSQGKTHNIKSAKRIVERAGKDVWGVLEGVIKEHPVLLNRAPTLHRLGIQAFEPVLVEGRAIKLHPLACGAFNADFDGDQMAVHVPLSIEAQVEARILMLASNNILKLSDGRPVCSPTQDMVIGCYYMTLDKKGAKGEGKIFADVDEAKMAYANKEIELQSAIEVRLFRTANGVRQSRRVKTTVGRLIFNEAIPQDLGFVDRSDPEKMFEPEINFTVNKSKLQKIVDATFKYKGATETVIVLDNIKALGFKYSTIGAITTSVFDMNIPAEKSEILKKAEDNVIKIEKLYAAGHMTEREKYTRVVHEWSEANKDVTKALEKTLDEFNPINMMAVSGARGSMKQIAQLSGMRGLMTNPQGETLETPVRSSFREGLSVLEYFISSHGGRKGLADTALKTAESGYLTRRLVDVAQDVIVREDDCFEDAAPKGVKTAAIMEGDQVIESLEDRLNGRFAAEDVIDPATKKPIVRVNEMITEEIAAQIVKAGIKEVSIRSVLTCKAKHGVCSKCYGKDMAGSTAVKIGEAVGIIAAQSIGEPGTQLTMRTFHTGGVAAADDITRGLPRVEDLFEARNPKGVAVISEYSGKVRIEEKDGVRYIYIKQDSGKEEKYVIPFTAHLMPSVTKGASVSAGDALTSGPVYPQDILRTKGKQDVQKYILKEVQSVYRSQGVQINDKHVEVIIRQMLKKVKVEDGGDTELLPGELVDLAVFEDAAAKVVEENATMPPDRHKRLPLAKPTLLGITKAALATDSFLSASSFQETARVLTEAAIKNKIDPLLGLKENVIIGKLIPAGTGMKAYKGIYPVEIGVSETGAVTETVTLASPGSLATASSNSAAKDVNR
ncbi:MAG: DNA-directed RNA polymerase subunit beta' [Clostridiales bacterium]|jgi:DNA-directed RNA polymerase subunit beta'|nr:DNA-directed RNA polymerase subunit beta' [Clostridiales bacterium]